VTYNEEKNLRADNIWVPGFVIPPQHNSDLRRPRKFKHGHNVPGFLLLNGENIWRNCACACRDIRIFNTAPSRIFCCATSQRGEPLRSNKYPRFLLVVTFGLRGSHPTIVIMSGRKHGLGWILSYIFFCEIFSRGISRLKANCDLRYPSPFGFSPFDQAYMLCFGQILDFDKGNPGYHGGLID